MISKIKVNHFIKLKKKRNYKYFDDFFLRKRLYGEIYANENINMIDFIKNYYNRDILILNSILIKRNIKKLMLNNKCILLNYIIDNYHNISKYIIRKIWNEHLTAYKIYLFTPEIISIVSNIL